jgi:hypothetical protein
LRRQTVVAHGRHAVRERRLVAAREHQHGLHILTFVQLAARLAGGLTSSVDDQTLRQAVQASLPTLTLGELDSLKALPGMVAAAVETIGKAWRAGIDLQARAASHPRLASLATLDVAILTALPPAMMRPADLVAAALARLDLAATYGLSAGVFRESWHAPGATTIVSLRPTIPFIVEMANDEAEPRHAC